MSGHHCTAWCTTTAHVDLVWYSDGHFTDEEVGRQYAAGYRIEGRRIAVDRIEPAHEVPPRPHLDGTPHLIWWRDIEDEQ